MLARGLSSLSKKTTSQSLKITTSTKLEDFLHCQKPLNLDSDSKTTFFNRIADIPATHAFFVRFVVENMKASFQKRD